MPAEAANGLEHSLTAGCRVAHVLDAMVRSALKEDKALLDDECAVRHLLQYGPDAVVVELQRVREMVRERLLSVTLYPAIIYQRRMNKERSGPFQNVVKLFMAWQGEKEVGNLLQAAARWQAEGVALPPTIGTNLDRKK